MITDPLNSTVGPLFVRARPPAELHLDARNPRRHSKRQVSQIAKSMKTFGCVTALLIDPKDRVIAGNGRLLAARQLGLQTVPTICVSHLTEEQIRAYQIADNRLSEIATWDDCLLGETLRDLSNLELGFELTITGFELPEIDLLIEGLNEPASKDDPADALPKPTGRPPVNQLGDLWQLGRHRLHCANALDPSAYATLMGGKTAAIVFTDPPYNVPIQGHVSGLGKIQHPEFAMASGEMTEAEFILFLTTFLRHTACHAKDGALLYICMDWRHLAELLTAASGANLVLKNLAVWVKDNAGMGSLYRSQHELILILKHGTAAHQNNVELGRHGRNRTNVWHYPGINTLRRISDEGDLLALHPTVKPVALVADALLDTSSRGSIVLDPFAGSGTTLIAAERVGRRCYAMELDPLYVDTIIERWQRYTGDTAHHILTGRSFAECASGRTALVSRRSPHVAPSVPATRSAETATPCLAMEITDVA